MSNKNSKVAIIGAGLVGSSTAFAMSLNQLVNELVLIDVNKEKSFGEALDINHGLSFVGQMSLYAGDYSDCRDADVIVITAGANRKPGESRLDLAKKNVMIAKEITSNIMKYYNNGVILVVSNPVDVLTYKIAEWSGLPHGRVIGSGTVLDSSRFRYFLSQKFNVDIRNVHGYIIGEHGNSQIPVWSATHISGKKIDEYCADSDNVFTESDKQKIAEEVKNAGANIIRNKGATYFAIAITVNTLVETLLKDQHTIRTVSSVIHGDYGIGDVAISLPAIITSEGVHKIFDLKLTAEEETALRFSAERVKEILLGVREI